MGACSEKPEARVYTEVLDRMRRLCSRREYCSQDILEKAEAAFLKEDGITVESAACMAAELVSVLVKERYVDDLRYASAFAREKAGIAGWGRVKISYALSIKGLDRDVVDSALAEIEPGKAEERLARLAEVKYRTLKDDPQCRLKMLRYILGRGYSYRQAESAVRSVMASSE